MHFKHLGQTITSGGRDAIHLAVEPVIAGETLNPVAFYRDSKGVLRVFIEEPIRTEIKTNKDENNNSSNADSC